MEINELLDRAKQIANIEKRLRPSKSTGDQTPAGSATTEKSKKTPKQRNCSKDSKRLAKLDEMQVIAEIELKNSENGKEERILETLH